MPKVAILGGGPAALAAAVELTADGRLDGRDVTLYQPGWRLGGKCASGRQADAYGRMLEHGLHVWFGCYDNAFEIMERCFAELGRDPATYAFTSVQETFEGVDLAVLWQRRGEEWSLHECEFPPHPRRPLNFLGFALEVLAWLGDALGRHGRGRPEDRVAARPVLARLGVDEEPSWEARLRRAVSRLQRRAAGALADVAGDSAGVLVEAADELMRLVDAVVPQAHRLQSADAAFCADLAELFAALLRGVCRDELLVRGFDAINDEDLAEWLRRHGARLAADPSDWPALLRAAYVGCFAFLDGDTSRPRMAAGRAVQGAVRCLFHYRGSVINRTRTSMGDAVMAPLYEVLERRGVRFRFFHAAAELVPSADATRIERIRVVEQVPGQRDYRPLITARFGGRTGGIVPAWPAAPAGRVRVPGDPERLEREIDPFGGAEHLLERGEDFDQVVLAVPPEVQRTICAGLAERDPAYAAMLAGSASVVTQACQFWMTRTAAQLGQPFSSRSLMSCYAEPIDTYADMSHLLPNERWPRGTDAAHLAYLCGVLDTRRVSTQAEADAAARRDVAAFLSREATRPWPDLPVPGVDALVPHPRAPVGGDPLDYQYVRANWAAPERYVLTLPGSVATRLSARGTRFENLVLAGDWTRNGFDVGCVEAAMTSGRLAAGAICGAPHRDEISGLDGPPGFPSRPASPHPASDSRSPCGVLASAEGALGRLLGEALRASAAGWRALPLP